MGLRPSPQRSILRPIPIAAICTYATFSDARSTTNTSGSLGFYESSFETLNLPNLTEVGGTLAINTNSRLNNITAPVLERVTGGVQVQNNTVLEEITFPALTTVTGATDMYGNFTS